jgi:hypothetical protein
MKRRKLLINLSCAALCLFIAQSSFAQSDTEFAKANQDYAAGRFQQAINGYETLVRSQ